MNDWELMRSWMMVLPPNRPSDELLRKIEETIDKHGRRETACILGSTPEYRSLISEKFRSVTIIDKSAEFKGVSDSIAGTNASENFVHGDWIDVLPRYAGKFDLVLSHSTHGNIPWSHRRTFYELIANTLKNSGWFIDSVFQPDEKSFDIPEIFSLFKDRANNIRTANDFNCLAIFRSKFAEEAGTVDSSKIYQWLEKNIDCPRIRKMIETTKLVCPPGMEWHYHKDRPPESFGYRDVFEASDVMQEAPESPFFGALTHRFCRKAQR